jgi:Uma2 family endonuclease
MSAIAASKYISIEDYLAAEEIALQKHEYYKGEVFAMAGAGIVHNRIVRNTSTEIDSFLRDKDYEIFPSDFRVYIEANSLFIYPDLTIFCEPIKMFKNRIDTATNPTVIIEVLSKSTQDYDRGSKFKLYRGLPSLKEYVIISSTEVLVEKYTKQADNKWQFITYNIVEDCFAIEAIGLSIEINSLYRGVTFEE